MSSLSKSAGVGRGAVALGLIALSLVLGSCSATEGLLRQHAAPAAVADDAGVAAPRISGEVKLDETVATPAPRVVVGVQPRSAASAAAAHLGPKGEGATLNFADTNIREVVRVILGDLLKANYTIDPGVKGTATFHTASPVSRAVLPQILDSLLAQNNAQLIRRDGMFEVVPLASGAINLQGGGAGGAIETTQVVSLRYASAPAVAKVLAPYVTPGSRVVAGPEKNSLLVSGSPAARRSLIGLIRTFDVDILADQSYAIFPVTFVEPDKVAAEVEAYVKAAGGSEADGPVHVMALERINAVLVVAKAPAYLRRIGAFIRQLDRVRDSAARRLYVYFVQNGTANDLANIMQKAFAPRAADNGTVGSLSPTAEPATISSPSLSSSATGSVGSALPGTGSSLPGTTTSPSGGTVSPTRLGTTSGFGSSSGAFGSRSNEEPETPVPVKGIRFIPDKRNNALLIFATPAEYGLISATLKKIDILPLQVMVEATIAEVTLNDALQYGTEFFFKKGSSTFTLSNAADGSIAAAFPGFAYAFSNASAQAAISALQSVTKVKVVSDPQLLVLNNESAQLQVGDLVPIVTQSAVSTLTAGAPTVNTVEYRETGVILQVTPRVNSGGLVTLDIQQEVSDVVPTTTSTIDSPTINQRKIKTRIVVQDGQTVGLGGLIKDTDNVSNNGVPWLTDIPVLGALFGTRNHAAARTELLILLTPHVIQDQRTVRELTRDLRAKLGGLSDQPITRDPIEPPGPLRK